MRLYYQFIQGIVDRLSQERADVWWQEGPDTLHSLRLTCARHSAERCTCMIHSVLPTTQWNGAPYFRQTHSFQMAWQSNWDTLGRSSQAGSSSDLPRGEAPDLSHRASGASGTPRGALAASPHTSAVLPALPAFSHLSAALPDSPPIPQPLGSCSLGAHSSPLSKWSLNQRVLVAVEGSGKCYVFCENGS